MRTTLSRFTVAFSDLDWNSVYPQHPEDHHIPVFPSAHEVKQYLERNSAKFGVDSVQHHEWRQHDLPRGQLSFLCTPTVPRRAPHPPISPGFRNRSQISTTRPCVIRSGPTRRRGKSSCDHNGFAKACSQRPRVFAITSWRRSKRPWLFRACVQRSSNAVICMYEHHRHMC